ncbi:hypothetical protein JYK14_07835 [Siccirubricoccus sp. KC 17139]|uniref:Uncharacterized protein n=1 Tax=Siccirubricoccus soli TaxID=2899147 RepID=A0ABT1D474_9PROT|nr:hypothetical protein [Siccirubricoccus soli]MCO6416080.1 hypothetical protein [Siccirubricoccus soli]MCP2682212.1 hypothetical protein [Siccirubricoccus soli]
MVDSLEQPTQERSVPRPRSKPLGDRKSPLYMVAWRDGAGAAVRHKGIFVSRDAALAFVFGHLVPPGATLRIEDDRRYPGAFAVLEGVSPQEWCCAVYRAKRAHLARALFGDDGDTEPKECATRATTT